MDRAMEESFAEEDGAEAQRTLRPARLQHCGLMF